MTYETTNNIESNTDTSHGVDNTLTHNNTLPASRDLPAIPSPRIQQLMGAVIDAELDSYRACARLTIEVAREYGIDPASTPLAYAWDNKARESVITYVRTERGGWEPIVTVSTLTIDDPRRWECDSPQVLRGLKAVYADDFEQEAA